mgnify:CR=1 FL=1
MLGDIIRKVGKVIVTWQSPVGPITIDTNKPPRPRRTQKK